MKEGGEEQSKREKNETQATNRKEDLSISVDSGGSGRGLSLKRTGQIIIQIVIIMPMDSVRKNELILRYIK